MGWDTSTYSILALLAKHLLEYAGDRDEEHPPLTDLSVRDDWDWPWAAILRLLRDGGQAYQETACLPTCSALAEVEAGVCCSMPCNATARVLISLQVSPCRLLSPLTPVADDWNAFLAKLCLQRLQARVSSLGWNRKLIAGLTMRP